MVAANWAGVTSGFSKNAALPLLTSADATSGERFNPVNGPEPRSTALNPPKPARTSSVSP
ncbi:MAG TPA: hypothetical protein DEQ28_01610 [Clostridiales bacterium]|nr:hypothetical protein [Clostridiales bacterium]